ncbi:MAG TPA: ABC transporter permease, partial [Dokdonella sp.]
MEIRPILSALMRSKVAMILIGLQVALTLAIVCNALFIISERLAHMARPSGMNEADTFWFGSNGFGQDFNVKVVQQSDLAVLRRLPGVVDAAPTNSVPMSDGGWGTGLSLAPRQKKSTADTTIYLVDDHAISTFGTHLIAGRNFKPEEIESHDFGDRLLPKVAILSKALADKMFPDGDPIGKQVYFDQDPPTTTIIGVVDRLQEPWISSDDIENAAFVPVFMPYGNSTRYLVRTEPGRRDEVMKQVEQ